MMKKAIKKLLAALLAVAMLCAMAVPALAAEDTNATTAAAGTGSITINNAVPNQTYTIYRILDLEYHADTNSYLYKVASGWESFVKAHSTDLELNETTRVVTWKNSNSDDGSSVIQNLANEAGTYAKDSTNHITEAGQKNATAITVKFTDLPLGWYLVVSDLDNGAICSIGTTATNAVIEEKNSKPTIEKEVYEGNKSGYSNDAGIGDTVNFYTNIYVTDGKPTNYVLHDTMTSGLNFDPQSVKVFLHRDRAGSENKFSNFLTANTDYELVTSTNDNCTFEIKFHKPLMPYDSIQVAYSATVTADAVIGTKGNDNDTYLKYGNDSTTEHSTTKTYVWEMGVRKFANLGESNKDHALADAEFRLYKMDGETKKYAKFTETSTGSSIYKLNKVDGWTATEADAPTVKTPTDGNIKFEGLDAGTYYLEETKAPVGYNKLTAPIKVEISSTLPTTAGTSASYTVKADGAETANYTVRVENKAGAVLPSTGGMGTTLFYVIGGGLMVAAIVLLVTKKRMENK